jgi:hypothetical protein
MTQTIDTVGDFMGIGADGLSPAQRDAMMAGKVMTSVRLLLAFVPGEDLGDLPDAVSKALKPLLELKIGDVIAAAWNTGRKLKAYADKPSPEEKPHKLGKHKIESKHHPKLTIAVNGRTVDGAEVPFTLSLSLEIASATLLVRNGRLMAANLDKCQGKGKLTIGELILSEPPPLEFALPKLTFGQGLDIM